jgi:hypothetical protein
MSLLTYGMIGDRLSDFVADLKEFTEFSNPDIGRVILNLGAIREECDRRVGEALLREQDTIRAERWSS